jgi:hypothetical protein
VLFAVVAVELAPQAASSDSSSNTGITEALLRQRRLFTTLMGGFLSLVIRAIDPQRSV